MAKVIFKDIAIDGAFEDFFSKEIENTDALHFFSLDFNQTIRWIWINGRTNCFGFRNCIEILNKLIETIHSEWLIPIGVLICFDASARNGKD